MAEIRGRGKRRDNALVGRVLVGMLHLGRAWSLGRRYQQVADIDDALQLGDAIEEIQRRVIRPIQFDIERDLGVILLILRVLGGRPIRGSVSRPISLALVHTREIRSETRRTPLRQ